MTVMAGVAAEAGEHVKERARRRATQSRQIRSPGGDKYQTAILAEFLAAIAVVAFLPLATGGPKDKSNPSPYTTNDIVQLVAIAVTYFILALIPGKGSRWAAWLGFLILLGIFYKKTATGELSAALTSIHPSSTGPTDETL
jgi:hypothetical protein